MNKLFIILLCVMFTVIILYPVESTISEYSWNESCYGGECIDRSDPSARRDWGGDQDGAREFCYNEVNGGCFL